MSLMLPHDWHPEPLPANCRLADGCWLYSSFAFRHFRSTRPLAVNVGADTGLYNGTFFDLGEEASVSIGRFCSIVGAIFSTNSRISIGDYVFISHEVIVADHETAAPPTGVIPATREPADQRDIVIEDDAWIGAQAVILGGVRIGAGAVVGAAAVVRQDVPARAIFAGNPGRVVGYVGNSESV